MKENKTDSEVLAEVLAEVRELKALVARPGQVEKHRESIKLTFDFEKMKKKEVMMHFVQMYERFGILGTKNQLQQFLAEHTNLGTKDAVDRLYNRCLHE